MKNLRMLIATVILIAVAAGVAFADGSSWVYDDLNISQIENCLSSVNSVEYRISVTREVLEDGTFYWRIIDRFSGLKMILLAFDEDTNNTDEFESLMIIVSFTMRSSAPSLTKLNAWNRDTRYAKAYLDEDGDPMLELNLSLNGGVTKEAIVNWVETAIEKTRSFAKYIGFS